MHVNNNIDVYLCHEELSISFSELTKQLDNKEPAIDIKFNIIENIDANLNSFILILDETSLSKLIKSDFFLNNYIFIIGDLNNKMIKNLNNSYINYELISSPINFLNLFNKLINLIEQKNNSSSEIIRFKKFNYSFQLNTIYIDNNFLYLTDKENEIFQTLVNNKNISLSKEQLLSKVWNYGVDIDTHTLETHIYTIRQKIEKKLKLRNIIIFKDEGYRVNSN